MTNFTKHNHLKYLIGGREYGYRETSIEPYQVSVGAVDPEVYKRSSYQNELRKTADSVYKEFGKDLVVFFSGGTDSEIVIRNFLSIGVKPRCVTIKFKHNFNAADVDEAERIARELDLPFETIEFDLNEFYESGHAKEFGEQLQCTQITYLLIYYNILKLGAPAVMGGEVLLTKNITRDDIFWYYTLRENEDASAMRFSAKYNIPLVNEWFSYSPELLLYFLESDGMQKLVNDPNNFKLSSVSSKNAILKQLYPEVTRKRKTHGFESLLAFNYEVYKNLGRDQIRRLEPSIDGIPLDQCLSQLRAKL
jgi:hypothetical protein